MQQQALEVQDDNPEAIQTQNNVRIDDISLEAAPSIDIPRLQAGKHNDGLRVVCPCLETLPVHLPVLCAVSTCQPMPPSRQAMVESVLLACLGAVIFDGGICSTFCLCCGGCYRTVPTHQAALQPFWETGWPATCLCPLIGRCCSAAATPAEAGGTADAVAAKDI